MPRARTRKTTPYGASVLSTITARVREVTAPHPWWHTTLVCIGILAVLSIIGGLFFAVGDKPNTVFTSDRVAPVDSPEFATALSKLINAPVERGGTIEILHNGDEFLPALLGDIDKAGQTINFTVYMWKDGKFSDRVLDALLRRQRQGVAVRVLLDGLGAKDAPDEKFDALRNAGGRVEKFRTPKFGKLTRLHRRNHRRSIVIDGKVGFTGGMAVYDRWLGHAQDPDHWRDMMFKVTGPMARSLQAAFADMWVSSSGEILVGSAIYQVAHATEDGIAQFIHLVNSPADDDQSMAYFFLLPILAARESIYLTTPYFIPDNHLKRALVQKARAGVDVRLLLPGRHIDNQSVRLSGQNHYDDLIEAGVRIFEYAPTFIHSKYAVIDRRWSIIGSPNLNSRSRQLDEENAFGILDRAFAEQLRAVFFTDLESTREINLSDWRRRNPFLRLVQLLSSALDEQS